MLNIEIPCAEGKGQVNFGGPVTEVANDVMNVIGGIYTGMNNQNHTEAEVFKRLILLSLMDKESPFNRETRILSGETVRIIPPDKK